MIIQQASNKDNDNTASKQARSLIEEEKKVAIIQAIKNMKSGEQTA